LKKNVGREKSTVRWSYIDFNNIYFVGFILKNKLNFIYVSNIFSF
jgi:hypothetical protein